MACCGGGGGGGGGAQGRLLLQLKRKALMAHSPISKAMRCSSAFISIFCFGKMVAMENNFQQSCRTTATARSADLRRIRGWDCSTLRGLQNGPVIAEALAFLKTGQCKPMLVAGTSAARPRRSSCTSKHGPTEAPLGDNPTAVDLTHATEVLGYCAWNGRRRGKWW